MQPDRPAPLSSSEILRLLKDDRGLDGEMRRAIASSLAIDVLTGVVPQRLRLDVASHRWPVSIVDPLANWKT
jgi:hypothetical protein